MIRSLSIVLGIALASACAPLAVGEEVRRPAASILLGIVRGRTLHPHHTALARDGASLAYRTSVDTISVFDPLTGKLLRDVTIREKEIGERFEYAADGKHWLFSAMRKFCVVNATTGEIVTTVGEDGGFDTNWRAFHASDSLGLLTETPDKTWLFEPAPKVRVWDVPNRQLLGEIVAAPNGGERREAVSGDGTLIATSGRQHQKQNDAEENVTEYVELWDAKSLQRKGRLHLGKDAYAVELKLNATGKRLVAISENDDGASLWDTAAARKVAALGRVPGGHARVTFSPDDRWFAVQSYNGHTVVCETATGKKVAERQCAGVASPAFGSANLVAAGVGFAAGGEIVACFVERAQVRVCVVNRDQQPPAPEPIGHRRPVVLTRFSADGTTILTVGQDGRGLRWDVKTGRPLETVFDESGRFDRLWDESSTFSADGKHLVLCEDGRLTLVDLENKRRVASLSTKTEQYITRFRRVDFTADMKKVIARGEGKERRADFENKVVGFAAAWNTADGSWISEFSDATPDGGEAAFAQNYAREKLLAAPGAPPSAPELEVGNAIRDPWSSPRNAIPPLMGNRITLRDRESKKVVFETALNANNGRGISFRPDGRMIAVPLNDGGVRLFDVR